MTDGGYRSELEAAQARIAQLEAKLAESEAMTSPAVVVAEARYKTAVERAKKGTTGRSLVLAAVMGVCTLPMVIIAATHHDYVMASIFALVMVTLSISLSWIMRRNLQKVYAAGVEKAAKELTEARHLQRLEDKVRELGAAPARIRVDASPAERVDALEESLEAEEQAALRQEK